MSRIGNKVITLAEGVTVDVQADNFVTVKGPKGELTLNIDSNIEVVINETEITVNTKNNTKRAREMHGTTNANIRNMLIGVTEGYVKGLEIVGVGYRFALKGNDLVVTAGYSHPVEVKVPEGIKLEVPSNTELFVRGADKQLVGEFAANVRKIRQPEPYKGKGIRYHDEHIIRKVGKKAA